MFIINSKELFNKKNNPNLSLSAKDIIKNNKITKICHKENSILVHNFLYNYDCFEDARILEGDMLGIPVKCADCETTGIEWWKYCNVRDENGNKIS